MKKVLLFILLVLLLMGAGCSSKYDQENQPLDTDQSVDNNEVEDVVEEDDIMGDVFDDYVLYENKAIGYTILRPDGWYWQHFMKADINTVNSSGLIDDYLVLDQTPIIGLGTEYLGRIVVEQSRMDIADLKKNMGEYTSQEVTINGQTATRFELQTDENHYFPNTKRIEYHLVKNDKIFRLIYHMADSDKFNEDIFTTMVLSFTWSDEVIAGS